MLSPANPRRLGIGRGSNPDHYRGYGIPIEERNGRFIEGLDMVVQAWQKEELDYNGQYYQAENIRLEPKPIQQLYPPVYVASVGADTFPLVGKLGHSIMVTPLIITVQVVSDGLAIYRDTLVEHGHDPATVKVVVNVPVYVGETPDAAKAGFAPTVNNYLDTLRSMQNNLRGSSRATQLSYELIYDELGAIKSRWDLAMTEPEAEAVVEMLQKCDNPPAVEVEPLDWGP